MQRRLTIPLGRGRSRQPASQVTGAAPLPPPPLPTAWCRRLSASTAFLLVPQEAAYIRQEARQQFRANQNKTSAEEVAKAVRGRLPAACSLLAVVREGMLSIMVCCVW